MNIQEKQQVVKDLHDKLSKSKIVILTDYKGLNVEAVTKLRSELRKDNVEYQVAKNTLLKRASEGTDAELLKDYFKGPSAIAFSLEEPVSPAKILSKFAEENDKLEIKIGVLDGKLVDINGIKALSSLPSKEVLLSQVLSAMNGVPTSFVRVLSGVPRGLLNVLQAIRDQKESA